MKNERAKFLKAAAGFIVCMAGGIFTIYLALCKVRVRNTPNQAVVVSVLALLLVMSVFSFVSIRWFLSYLKSTKDMDGMENRDYLFRFLSYIFIAPLVPLIIACYGAFLLLLWSTGK